MTGATRAPASQATLDRWERVADPFLVIAAIVPLIGNVTDVSPTLGTWSVELACWLVFVVDLAVHLRLRPGYLRTTAGKIDLFIVVATFPWSVVIGDERARLLALFRLARVARIVVILRRSALVRTLVERLGRPTVVLVATVLICAFVIYRNEPASAGFRDYGDALWFGIVTVTTVGYGELAATTTESRIAAVAMMVVGLMFLGSVLATATAALRGRHGESADRAPERDERRDRPSPLTEEVRALRAELRELRAIVERLGPDAPADPAGGSTPTRRPT